MQFWKFIVSRTKNIALLGQASSETVSCTLSPVAGVGPAGITDLSQYQLHTAREKKTEILYFQLQLDSFPPRDLARNSRWAWPSLGMPSPSDSATAKFSFICKLNLQFTN